MEPVFLREMTNSRQHWVKQNTRGAWNICQKKKRNVQRMMETCHNDLRASLKGLLLANLD